jgi:hypothetical protein
MSKLFRFHRGSLAESLETTIEVSGIHDLRRILAVEMPYVHNVRISLASDKDDRLPAEWGGYSRYVLADFDGFSGQCIGMCNFYDD